MFWLLLRQNIFYDNLNLQLFFFFFFFQQKVKAILTFIIESMKSLPLPLGHSLCHSKASDVKVFNLICFQSFVSCRPFQELEVLIYLASASSVVYNETTVYFLEDVHRTNTCPPTHTNNCALNLYETKGYIQCWRSMVATLQQRGLVATSFG